jgi:ribosomal protein S18 acetylase RimI-like enzyme
MKIVEWVNNKSLNLIFFEKIKKIKDTSLICSLRRPLLIEYFDFIKSQNGTVLIGVNKNKIIGLLIFEKKKNISIIFFKKNLFKIGLKLFFSKLISDKIILLKFFINFFFLKKNQTTGFNNQIIFLAVDKNLTGQGFGKRFIDKIKKITNKNIYVLVETNNTKAQNFYIKNNFVLYFNIMHGLNKIKVFKFSNKLS